MLLAAAGLLLPATARALPSFARQTSLSCTACHLDYPELTPVGRQFKLGGYTMSSDTSKMPPFAVMLLPSFTHTARSQAGGAAPGFRDNNNFALTQASVFYAGRLFGPYAGSLFGQDFAAVVDKIGIFSQVAYDGIAKTWAWDNVELRFAESGKLGGHAASYGFYANNNPTMQDPWNSTPVWNAPFSSSGLAPTPAAAPMLDGGFAQQVAGAGAYAMFDGKLYVDLAAYHTLGSRLQKSLGVDPTVEAQIGGLAPYWRVAAQQTVGGGVLEFGTFGMASRTYPERDGSAGRDRIVDVGLDTQYDLSFGKNDLSANLSWIHERQTWTASEALGLAANPVDTLRSRKATVHYLRDQTYGLTGQYFAVSGNTDTVRFGDSRTGSPNSSGFMLQADFLPLNKGGGPRVWPKSNVKITVQYVAYRKFDGARTNYDGAGRNASDNNTLYLETWFAF